MVRETQRISFTSNPNELPDAIIGRLERANVFYSQDYSQYVSQRREVLYFLYSDEYIIPVRIRRAYIFISAIFASEYLKFVEDASQPPIEFLNQCVDLLVNVFRVQWILSPASAFFDCFPNHSRVIPFGSHVIDLTLSEDEIWARMHSKHRNSIRRAEKSGVSIVKGGAELLGEYLVIDNTTWERSKLPKKSYSYYKDMAEALKHHFKVYIALKDGIPQAGAIFFYNCNMCYYMFGATSNNPETGSANLLHWNAIRDMKCTGVRRYSFVGCRISVDENSKYQGIQRFKERFGGELVQGYLFRYVSSYTMYKLFTIGMQLRSRGVKYEDAIDQEMHKWKTLQSSQE